MKYKKTALNFSFLIFFLALFISDLKSLMILTAFFILFCLYSNIKSLSFSGGFKLWLAPILFIGMMPFFYGDLFVFSIAGFKKAFSVFLHLYMFNCVVNLINDNLNFNDISSALKKRGFNKLAVSSAVALCSLKKIRKDVLEIMFYANKNRSFFSFLKSVRLFFYSVIRNSVKISNDISELLYTRRIKI